jgi:hypothetical protein
VSKLDIVADEKITADIVIQNKSIAHSHVPEQRDMYESWVSFTVRDSTGKILRQSGFIKPSGELDERAHSFTNRLVSTTSLSSRKSLNSNKLETIWPVDRRWVLADPIGEGLTLRFAPSSPFTSQCFTLSHCG